MKYLIFLLLIVASTDKGCTQSKELSNPELYFTAIIVNDMDTTINWYSDKLGFEILNRFESVERGFKQANLKRGNVLVELIETNKTISPETILTDKPKKTKIGGYFKIGFAVSDFDEWVEYLTISGVEFYGEVVADPNSGKKMVILKDPDGNRVQLFEK